jgi:hypothetical protein
MNKELKLRLGKVSNLSYMHLSDGNVRGYRWALRYNFINPVDVAAVRNGQQCKQPSSWQGLSGSRARAQDCFSSTSSGPKNQCDSSLPREPIEDPTIWSRFKKTHGGTKHGESHAFVKLSGSLRADPLAPLHSTS